MEIVDSLYEKMQDSLKTKIERRSSALSEVEFIMCSDELKKTYISGQNIGYDSYVLTDLSFSTLNDELKKAYIDRLIRINKSLTYKSFNTIQSNELRQYFIDKVVSNNRINIHSRIFDKIADNQKIEYIMYRGFDSCDTNIKEWYSKWKEAKGREHRMDKILLD